MNAFIQSSVSGLMNLLQMKFFDACPWADYIATIHDECLFQIPEHRKAEARAIWDAAVESLNDDLAWSVKIRTGWAEGRDWFEAK
jgi:DNA polymerase I-like protein with 3'-5' exonuclease and polymerase domains